MKLEEIKPLNETLKTAKDVEKSTKASIKFFEKSMSSMFPKNQWKAEIEKRGGKGVGIALVIRLKESKPSTQIDNFKINLMMHISTTLGGDYVPKDNYEVKLMLMGKQFKNSGIKFKKIKGKTPDDAMQKVVSWFKAHKDLINGIRNPNREGLLDVLYKKFKLSKADIKNKVMVDLSTNLAKDIESPETIALQDLDTPTLMLMVNSPALKKMRM